MSCDSGGQKWTFQHYVVEAYEGLLPKLEKAMLSSHLKDINGLCAMVCHLILVERFRELNNQSTRRTITQQDVISTVLEKPQGMVLRCLCCLEKVSGMNLALCHFCRVALFRSGGCISRHRTKKFQTHTRDYVTDLDLEEFRMAPCAKKKRGPEARGKLSTITAVSSGPSATRCC